MVAKTNVHVGTNLPRRRILMGYAYCYSLEWRFFGICEEVSWYLDNMVSLEIKYA